MFGSKTGWNPRLLAPLNPPQSWALDSQTFTLLVGSRHCPSLWAGTNGGTVYAFSLRVPPAERRTDEPVRAEQGEWWMGKYRGPDLLGWVVWCHRATHHSPVPNLPLPRSTSFVAKEIQLMHRAPVVGILVLDGHNVPLPEPLEVAHDLSKSPDMQGSHQLLVVSEEQFKVTRERAPWMFLRHQ